MHAKCEIVETEKEFRKLFEEAKTEWNVELAESAGGAANNNFNKYELVKN